MIRIHQMARWNKCNQMNRSPEHLLFSLTPASREPMTTATGTTKEPPLASQTSKPKAAHWAGERTIPPR